jgi:signal transduction histidine kinase
VLIRRTADEKTMSVGNRILSSGARMGRMIEQLLDLARARLGGGIPLSPESVDLRELARHVVSEHRALESARVIELETTGDLTGRWDEPRLAQVLSNLLGNALQHGDAHTNISLRIDGGTDRIVVRVHNWGVIPQELLPSLFEPFRSGRDAHRQSEGLGLGLYIVDQVVRSHAGTIHVDSTVGEGTTFTVELPRTVPSSPEAQRSREQEPA